MRARGGISETLRQRRAVACSIIFQRPAKAGDKRTIPTGLHTPAEGSDGRHHQSVRGSTDFVFDRQVDPEYRDNPAPRFARLRANAFSAPRALRSRQH